MTELTFKRITSCPKVGDRIFINHWGSMRPAIVDISEDDVHIEFVFEDDGSAWSLESVMPGGWNPLIFKMK
jgi:hypothetical protein